MVVEKKKKLLKMTGAAMAVDIPLVEEDETGECSTMSLDEKVWFHFQ